MGRLPKRSNVMGESDDRWLFIQQDALDLNWDKGETMAMDSINRLGGGLLCVS